MPDHGRGCHALDDPIAWQLANTFKQEVYRLLRAHQAAWADSRFRDQLRMSAASVGINIAEGFHRYRAREFARFLSIALASLGEATLWLRDGIDRGYFAPSACEQAFVLAKRCHVATLRLKRKLDEMSGEK